MRQCVACGRNCKLSCSKGHALCYECQRQGVRCPTCRVQRAQRTANRASSIQRSQQAVAAASAPIYTPPPALVPVRPALGDMTDVEFDAWVNMARAGLSEMIAFVQSYLDRRAARGTNTGTDLAYRRYIVLLHDLLQAMKEIDALRVNAPVVPTQQAHSNLTGDLLMMGYDPDYDDPQAKPKP